MKTIKKAGLLALALGLLASCGGSETSESGSDNSSGGDSASVIGDEVAFEDAINLLTGFAKKEGSASGETYIEAIDKSGSITTLDKSLKMYEDNSSYGSGTLTKTSADGTKQSTTFKEGTSVVEDKVAFSSGTKTVQTSYYAIDYADDSITDNTYGDKATRVFAFESEEEATDLGFSSGEYILEANLDYQSSYALNETLAEWITANLINSPYVQQTGKTSFEKTEQSDGTYSFFVGISYSLSDSGYTYFYINDVTFVADKDLTKLLSFSIDYEIHIINDEDSEDTADEVYKYSGAIAYDEKGANDSGGTMIPYNYFLQDITEIELLDSSRKAIDPTGVTIGASFVFARPKTYSPAIAIGLDEWTLSRYASSNGTVIQLTDDGYFQVMSTGSTTLTFAYYGLDLTTKIWQTKTISIDVTVVQAEPSEISVSSLLTDETAGGSCSFDQLKSGHTYAVTVVVSPSDAPQEVTATVDDESVLTVSITTDANGAQTIEINALAAGTANVTFASETKPEVSKTCAFTVESGLTDDEAYALLVGKTFTYDSGYGYTESMKFTDQTNGTVDVVTSSTTYNLTFTYTVSGNNLSFTFAENSDLGDLYDSMVFDAGILSSDGQSLTCENSSTYKEFDFTLAA
jgi:hypothetical protein